MKMMSVRRTKMRTRWDESEKNEDKEDETASVRTEWHSN